MRLRPIRNLLPIGLFIVFLWGTLTLLQNHLLYFPEKLTLAEALPDAARHGLVPWLSDREFLGWLREPGQLARATLVLWHGNAGHAGQRYEYADVFSSLGLRVLLAEYPGYGPREGALGENTLVADAMQLVARLRRQYPGPLLLAGESLGAGVAAAVVAASPASPAGLLLITPWDRLSAVARHHYPWVPVDWLLHDRYNSVTNLARYPGRVAVVVAGADRIVPPAFGQALFAVLPGPKRLWTVSGADHNDWTMWVDAAWWWSVVDYLLDGGP